MSTKEEASHWWSKNIEHLADATMVDVLTAFHEHMRKMAYATSDDLIEKIQDQTMAAPDDVPTLRMLLEKHLYP